MNKALYAGYTLNKCKPLMDLIQEAARTEKDPFYRYRFEQVALSAHEAMTEYNRGRSSPSSQRGGVLDAMGDDEPEDECQCADCQAERAREARAKRSTPKDRNDQKQGQPC